MQGIKTEVKVVGMFKSGWKKRYGTSFPNNSDQFLFRMARGAAKKLLSKMNYEIGKIYKLFVYYYNFHADDVVEEKRHDMWSVFQCITDFYNYCSINSIDNLEYVSKNSLESIEEDVVTLDRNSMLILEDD